MHLAYYFYCIVLLYASFFSIYRFNKLDSASKILAIMVCCAFLNECTAYYLAVKYKNNLSLYSLYSLIEFPLLCLYFNKVIDIFIKRNIGIYIAIFGVTLGIINIVFIQHLNSLNSFFLFFEGLCVIAMSLFAFFRLLLKNENLKLFKYPHFLFISTLIFFWSITILNWGFYDYFIQRLKEDIWKIDLFILIVNMITYTSLGSIFLLYPKLSAENE